MKLGIVGKGGVGKTTISALIAQSYVAHSKRVIAIDTDSNPNLGVSLGLTLEQSEQIPVLPRSLIVGSGADLSPEELVAKYGHPTPAGVTLLSAIKVTEAGAGCTCGGHATVRSLLGTALETEADVTLVDMEAGIEHLSRSGGTLAYADILLVVAEPTRKAVMTAARTLALAEELGISRTYLVGNKAHLPADKAFFTEQCERVGLPLAGVVPFDLQVADADRLGMSLPADHGASVRTAVDEVVNFLQEVYTAA